MFNQTFFYTSFFAALFMTISLKLLHKFKFIKWSPIAWTKKLQFFETMPLSLKWVSLFIGLAIVFAILYFITSYLDTIPPSITALLFCIVIIVSIEWLISKPETPMKALKSISIPLLTVTAIVFRFIVGTSVFMRKVSRKV